MAKLTSEQKREIAELREAGWSYARLAERFGVSSSSVHYHCLCQGAVSPRTHAVRNPGPDVIHASDGRTQRRFTAAEDAALLAAAADGLSVLAIARRVGRPITSTRYRLMTLALRDDGYGLEPDA